MSEDAGDSRSLSALLQRDDLLQKVLSHLVEDGLCECRRVCRRWHDVCSGLPVQLHNAPSSVALTFANKFPNTDSASFLDIGGSLEPGEPPLATSLAQMQQLRHLGLLALDEWQLPDGLWDVLLSMKTLRSLSLTFTESPEVAAEFMEVARSLTMLTSLSFVTLDDWFNLPFDPVTELRQLRRLTATPDVLWDEKLSPRFPHLSHLTRLDCQHVCKNRVWQASVLQVISPASQWNTVVDDDL